MTQKCTDFSQSKVLTGTLSSGCIRNMMEKFFNFLFGKRTKRIHVEKETVVTKSHDVFGNVVELSKKSRWKLYIRELFFIKQYIEFPEYSFWLGCNPFRDNVNEHVRIRLSGSPRYVNSIESEDVALDIAKTIEENHGNFIVDD